MGRWFWAPFLLGGMAVAESLETLSSAVFAPALPVQKEVIACDSKLCSFAKVRRNSEELF